MAIFEPIYLEDLILFFKNDSKVVEEMGTNSVPYMSKYLLIPIIREELIFLFVGI